MLLHIIAHLSHQAVYDDVYRAMQRLVAHMQNPDGGRWCQWAVLRGRPWPSIYLACS